jgi:hypothetical protein
MSMTETAPVGFGSAPGIPPNAAQLPIDTTAAAPATVSFSMSTLLIPAMVE